MDRLDWKLLSLTGVCAFTGLSLTTALLHRHHSVVESADLVVIEGAGPLGIQWPVGGTPLEIPSQGILEIGLDGEANFLSRAAHPTRSRPTVFRLPTVRSVPGGPFVRPVGVGPSRRFWPSR